MRNAERGNGRAGDESDLEGETEAGPEIGAGVGRLAVWGSWVKILGGGESGVRPLPTLHGKVRVRGDFGVGRRCKRLGERGLSRFFGAPRGGAQVERCVYLAFPSWHPEKNSRPLSPNDLQRFPPENTAPPRPFRFQSRQGHGLPRAPRIDPGVRHYRTGFLPFPPLFPTGAGRRNIPRHGR
jgi:hypothetical protein